MEIYLRIIQKRCSDETGILRRKRGDKLAKFELTYKQYMDSVICTLSSKLSTRCAISIIKNEFGYGGLKTIMKEYPEFDSLRLEWDDWHYTFDTKAIEKSYNEERSINEFADMLIDQIKAEFVKQILREEKEK